MPLQSLQLPNHPHVCTSGDVTIHPSAAIAPGAILRAGPNSRISIAGGACIGMGVILNAYEGAIEIGEGASLGPGVLVVGNSLIGANACIGGATTIFNASVDSLQVVAAGSILGDASRQVSIVAEEEEGATVASVEAIADAQQSEDSREPEHSPSPATQEGTQQIQTSVYGQVHVNQLLLTLFPHGQSLNNRHQSQPKGKEME